MYNTLVTDQERCSTGRLVLYFLRLGAVGFGGPAALAARMQRELVEERGWIREQEYLDGLAFAQLAPGPLAAQLAMYLGYTLGGVGGCTLAGAAFVLPSFFMVLAISGAYVAYGGLPIVAGLFYGIGPAAIGIVAVAAVRLAVRTVKRDALLAAIYVASAGWTAILQRELVAAFVGAGVLAMWARRPRAAGSSMASFGPMALATAAPAAPGLPGLALFFAKAGLFVFGSGLAIVPFLYDGVVRDQHWLTDQQFVDAIAVAMITPGPVVITVAFIGFLVAGVPGAVVSAAAIFAPVYLMVVIAAPAFRRWSARPAIRAFVGGVTAAAAGGITGAAIVLAERSVHDAFGMFLAIIAACAAAARVPEPAVVAAGGLAGLTARGLL